MLAAASSVISSRVQSRPPHDAHSAAACPNARVEQAPRNLDCAHVAVFGDRRHPARVSQLWLLTGADGAAGVGRLVGSVGDGGGTTGSSKKTQTIKQAKVVVEIVTCLADIGFENSLLMSP